MIVDKALVAERFARAADTYDDAAEVQRRVARRLAALIREHAATPAERVLEVGCGTGCLSRLLRAALRPRRMVLNDMCPSMRERLGDVLGRGVEFVPGDAEAWPFGEGFDLVASSSAVQWFADPGAFFARCRRALDDGGCLAFSTYGPDNLRQIAGLTGAGLRRRSLEEWVALLDGSWRIAAAGEERIDMAFDSPLDVLRHMQRTGVTGVRRHRWSAGALRRFAAEYGRLHSRDGRVLLTYHPIHVVAVKG